MKRFELCDALIGAIVAALGANYWLHRTGRPTICCRLRWSGHADHPLGRIVLRGAIRGAVEWFDPHLLNPEKRPVR